jgi:competence protein ComEA
LTDQSAYPSATHKMTPAEKSNTPEAHGQPVDLNSGSKKDLAALPGVGPDLAQNIIVARPFKSKEDLLRKKIIPPSTFNQIKDLVTVQGPKKQSVPTKSNPE